MSLDNFIPQLVHAEMWKEREKKFVGIANCNRKYEGAIKEQGDRVKITGMGDINIHNYTKNNFAVGLNLQIPDDQSTWLYITEAKYFNIGIDSIDEKQSTVELSPEAKRKAALAQNDVADQFIFKKHADAATTITEAALTSKNAAFTIGKAIQALYENNVPTGEKMCLEVSPDVYMKLLFAKILQDTDNSAHIENGYKGKFLNCDVYMSNNIQKTTTVNHCLLRTTNAISYAEQYVETKIYDLGKDGFGQAVKQLMLYGAKTVYPKELIRLNLTCADEVVA